MQTLARQDPLRGFRFLVEMDGVAIGGFARIKGLVREIKRESYHEGGVNDYEHQLMSCVTHPVALTDLWQWALDASGGDIVRRKVTVRLNNEANERAWAWHIDDAFPVKWSCSDLDANASQVAMESLELAHHGLRKDS